MKAGDKVQIEGVEVTLLRLVHDGDRDPKTKEPLTNPQRNKWWASNPTSPGSSIQERFILCTDQP